MNIINSISNICSFQKTNDNKAPRFKKGASNLAPLEKDTVSFSGGAKRNKREELIDKLCISVQEAQSNVRAEQDDKNFEKSDRTSLKLAQTLYDDSEYAYGHLKYMLARTLNTSVLDVDSPDFERQFYQELKSNKDKPIFVVTSRRKKPDSICEKMAENHLKSKKSAKEELHDLIGARIILTGKSTKEGDYVLDKLTKAVSQKHLRIKSIKSHSQENPKTRYVTQSKIDRLVNTARKNGNPLCSFSDKPRDSGYLALHIITDEIDDGYQAEIQIMGYDVEKFKQLEDLCYKCAFGKNVPKKYEQIAQLLSQVKERPVLKEQFIEYTKRAYEYERLRPFEPEEHYTHEFFPIPSDLNIPKELDFNNLNRIKTSIDNKEKFLEKKSAE